uniref:receptor-like serine/threonine-protein kinase ALE2 isoform X2 n=1 Tax=Erigeron canadensis TaxID=72917 RepID=UPI001CB927F8|nr:receptor-like serine/threonine-protein kinase ALE2 isoform X2 [Erigeron canadensis]
MNLMVKYMLLVLQVYAIASSAVLQGFSASTNLEPASGPLGNTPLEPSSPKTLPNGAAPIMSTPERSAPSPPVIPPTVPVSMPPIPLPEKGPTIELPLSPQTVPVQIAPTPKEEPQSPPPSKEEPQNPPPVTQAASPSLSQVPPSMPQSPPSILPEPVASPPTNLPMASPPSSPTVPVPTFNLPLPAVPPSTLPSAPPVPSTNMPMAPPPTSPILPVSPPNLPLPADIPPTTLPSSPPMPPTNLPMAPPPTSPVLPLSPPNLPAPAELPPSTLPSSPPMPPLNLPMPPPPTSPALPVPPPNLPFPVELPPSTFPSSPPMTPVPPSNLSAPVASPPSTLPANPPPSPSTLSVPPPNLPVLVPSPSSTFPRDPPPSPPTVTMPPPHLPGPVASPPQISQKNTPPPNSTFATPPSDRPEPHVSPISPISTPIPPSPKNQTNDIAPSQRSQVKDPVVHKGPSSNDHAPPPYSSSKSPAIISHTPPSFPPLYPPPPAGLKNKPAHHYSPPPSGPVSKPRHLASPPSPGKAPRIENSVSPSVSPPRTSPSIQTIVLPPKVSPTRSSPRFPRPLQALPPPPPNEDCLSMTCVEPLTTTPPGTPCKCVLPMQVELGLGVSLYTFFPLVSELATEMATGLFMRSSQVRIMGANEDNQDSEKTIVIIDLVPLGEKFDNYTAYITAQKLWQKQVPIKSSLFGDYEVLYVKYPGLPPSPPMPSSRNGMNGEPYGHGNNGRDIKPLGVDVGKQKHSNRLSGGVISIIILSAVVAVILVSVAVWVLLVKNRDRSRPGQTPTTTLPSVTKSSGIGGSMTGSGPESASLSFRSTIAYNGSAKTFSLSDMEKATDNFNELGVLGEGGFGRVYGGLLEDGTKVAVKVLKRDDQQGGREFLAEVEMLSRLHHRNLVRLLGICTEERNRCLVYELIPNGSVESHLHGIDKEIAPLDWGARLKIALGAARGLAYLHEDSSPRVIHRDFKSSNILLEHDFTPKVSDFGLARSALDEENQHISTRVMGTFGYVAPEYAMTGHLLVKSDVYSYGVVLLELLSGRKPVDMSMPPGQENLVAWARPLLPTPEGLNLLIDPSLSPEVPFDSIAKVAAIASMCVQPEVSHRPFMGEVVQALKLVCNECEETRDLGSRTCSQEDLASMDFDPRDSTNSGPPPGASRSTYPTYESPLDVESGFPGHGLDVDSFRLTSSSGPLRPRRSLQIWERMKRFSSGSMSDYGEVLRLLARSR